MRLHINSTQALISAHSARRMELFTMSRVFFQETLLTQDCNYLKRMDQENLSFKEHQTLSKNKDKLAIVCVGYNRLEGLKRLLKSLLAANYLGDSVPLVISIDASYDQNLYEYVRSFTWPYGDLFINIQQERLGLRKHIYQCGDLTVFFKAITILEDDLYVSSCFYKFYKKAVEFYANNERVVGISLYAPEMNGYAELPFTPLENGSDTYLLQDVCTWGEIFTYSMWNRFRQWMEIPNCEEIIASADIPSRVKGWKNAWSKYYYGFMDSVDGTFVYPYKSLVTNFSDSGVHGNATSHVQVSLLQNDVRDYLFLPITDCVSYDMFSNNEVLYESLDIDRSELCLDMYGTNCNYRHKKYLLSPLELPYHIVEGYSLKMRPHELNIINKILGDDVRLYDTSIPDKVVKKDLLSYGNYYLKGFRHSILRKLVLQNVIPMVMSKLKIK